MQYIARWGPKGFLVSPEKIVPFDGFSTGYALKSDSKNDTSGTQPTNTRGRELMSMSFETTYLSAAGVDPRGQLEEWEKLLDKSYPLLIGGKRFGPPKMKLKNVNASDFRFTNTGAILQIKVSITLEEDSKGATSAVVSTKKTSKTENKKEAMNSTATKEEKAEKKPKFKSGGVTR